VDEWLFLNDRGELCEGTITNLFVTLADGRCLTPPLEAGLLPGILREELLTRGAVREGRLSPDMLTGATLTLGNSLRGEIAAQLL
jgi:4-amino-4-deoxychorismate lyase